MIYIKTDFIFIVIFFKDDTRRVFLATDVDLDDMITIYDKDDIHVFHYSDISSLFLNFR